ncbi:cytochrome p450 domain-containing protein [Sarocladium implicatum]|nr:cytochrome p450 domain-containing protein [Sarocladium implicatum]
MAILSIPRLGLDPNTIVSLLLTLTSTLPVILLMRWAFTVHLGENEPPALRPRVPIIGHLFGLMTQGTAFFVNLKPENRMPAASLPILNGKMYTIWDPHLMQGVFRNRVLTVKPYMVKFLKAQVAYPSQYDEMVRTSTFMDDTIKCLHSSMSAQNVYRMNANALRYLSGVLDAIPASEPLEIPNLWLWIRDELTVATCEALYGSHNPFKPGNRLLDDTWTLEANVPYFLMGLWPSIFAPAAYRARIRLQAALRGFYSKRHDSDDLAAPIVHECAQVIRQHGVSEGDVGYFGLPILFVATANSIPVAFWFFSEVFSRPELVRDLRDECNGAISWGAGDERKTATVNLDVLADKCPLLFSCYRETIRTNNETPISRKVTEDTTITDGKGLTYSLKEGTDLQCSMGALHLDEKLWGPGAGRFEPARFLQMDNESARASKDRRASFAPFGGGLHLCPGRTFAQAENLGFVLALVLGYEVSPMNSTGGGWDTVVLPGKQPLALGQALHKPMNGGEGFGVRIARRRGWESVKWNFVSGSK